MKIGYVYFITFEDAEFRLKMPAIKIGSTYDIEKRMRALSTGSPMPLKLIGFLVHNPPSHLEAKLQYEFHEFRMNGEWFRASVGLIEELTTLDQKFDILDDLFKFDKEIAEKEWANYRVQRLLERIDKKEDTIKELLGHIKKVDPSGFPIIYQRVISGRPFHMQKRLKTK